MINGASKKGSSKEEFKSLALQVPILFVCLSFLPFTYGMLNQIPDNLTRSKGTFSTKRIGKNTYTVISSEQGKLMLTCASSFKGYTKCLPDEASSELTNKEATAFWYKQKILPFMENNKLVELYVGGSTVISGEMTKERMTKHKKYSISTSLEMFTLTLLISAFFLKKSRES